MNFGAQVTSHVFNALNYDHPFVYIYEVSLPWSVPLAPICWAIYALAVLDVTAGISRRREFRVEHPEVVPVALFLAVMTAVSLALISVSAVESRFSTLIFASASVFACHCVLRIRGMSKPRRSRIVATSTIVAVVGMLTSEWMKTLSMPS